MQGLFLIIIFSGKRYKKQYTSSIFWTQTLSVKDFTAVCC